MKTRPWPLVLLGVFQLLTPLANLWFNSWSLQVPPRYVIGWLMERSSLEIFESVALMPIAGLAILIMKRWSYPIFFVAMIWSVFANIRHLSYMSQTLHPFAMVSVYLLEIALVVYFLMPSVRKTYMDASVRWWETKPRYDVKLPLKLHFENQTLSGVLINLSEGGAFLSAEKPLRSGLILELEFTILSLVYKVQGKIVHMRSTEAGTSSYGMQFIHTPETARSLSGLTKGLGYMGFPNRSENQPWYFSLLRWFENLVTTGRGFTPQIQYRKKD